MRLDYQPAQIEPEAIATRIPPACAIGSIKGLGKPRYVFRSDTDPVVLDR